VELQLVVRRQVAARQEAARQEPGALRLAGLPAEPRLVVQLRQLAEPRPEVQRREVQRRPLPLEASPSRLLLKEPEIPVRGETTTAS
jgi:hypothetical protein